MFQIIYNNTNSLIMVIHLINIPLEMRLNFFRGNIFIHADYFPAAYCS